jgi:Na+-transporting NADH:ubiquinone oxidoreductase subunit NqrB
MNVFAMLAPLVSSIPAANQFIAQNPTASADAAYGFYLLGILAIFPVLISLFATRIIGNRKFFISITLLMFTFSLMNTIFFHQTYGGMLIISILLIQFLIAIPSILYAIAFKLSGQNKH